MTFEDCVHTRCWEAAQEAMQVLIVAATYFLRSVAQESHSDVVNHVEALRGIPLQRTSIAIPWPAKHGALRNIADRLVLERLRPFSPMLNPEVRLVELAEVGAAEQLRPAQRPRIRWPGGWRGGVQAGGAALTARLCF